MLKDRRQFFIRQHAALFKLAGAYDILDPGSQEVIGSVKETPPGWAKLLRLFINKGFLPTAAEVREAGAVRPAFTLHKSPGVLRHRVTVRDESGQSLGFFQSKAFSWRSRLMLHGADGVQLGELSGDWKGWDFTLRNVQGKEIGKVTKKWAGIGKELFTTADSYMVSLADDVPAAGTLATLMLAAGLAVDLALKEHAG